MKKIILLIMTIAALNAKPLLPQANIKTLLQIPIVGAVMLPFLVIGDARWQYLTNRRNCTNATYIYPKVPCSKWFPKR